LITRPLAELFGRHPGYGFAGLGVNTAIGNFTVSTYDLMFSSGLLGLLDWQRTYNSRNDAAGVLGPGWSTSFGARLVPPASGILHHGGPVTFFDEDGRELVFTPAADGQYLRPQDLNGSLVRNQDGSFVLRYNSGLTWAFDATGRLAGRSLEDQSVSLDFDAAGQLMRAVHSSGAYLAFSYDAVGRLAEIATSDGRAVSMAYTAGPGGVSLLQAVTSPGGGTARFEWTGTGDASQIARVTNADGYLVVANAYADPMSRVTGQQFPGGGGAGFRYDDAAGTTVVASLPSGGQFTFQANQQGRMTRVTRPDGSSATFGYDANGQLTQGTTPGGTQFEQSFDGNGNVLSATYGGATTIWTYDDASRPTSLTDPTGAVTSYGYSGASGIPSLVTDPDGGATRITASGGLVTSRTDADGNTTSYGYDPAGNLVTVTSPLGQVWQFGYDSAGNRVSFTTPSGAVTRFQYDPAGRLIASTDPSGAVMRYEYSASGLLLRTTDQAGGTYLIDHDEAGHVAKVTDPLGRAGSYTYDPDGNPVTFTDPGGSVSRAEYDVLGRLAAMTDANGAVVRRCTYDADGNQLTEETPAGTSSMSYDARGNQVSVTDRLGATTHYAYDPADRLIETTYPDGAVHRTSYDAAGFGVASIDPLGGVTRRVFTPAGSIAAVIDPLGRRTSYTLDADGRITEVANPEGGVTRFAYDADGRRISVTTPAGLVTSYRYNSAGRLAAVVSPLGWVTGYGYSPRGDLTAVVRPDGAIWSYRYDAAGQLMELTDPNGSVTEYGYDNAGRVIALTDPKRAVTHYGYTANGQLASITDPLGRTIQRGYDAAGQLVTITDPAGHVLHLAYDAMNRLIRKTADGAAGVTFSYDAAGRRASMTDATGTTRYAYDLAGQLISVTGPDGGVTSAGYDAAGQRVSLTYPSGLQLGYSYDLNGRLIGLLDPRAGEAVYALDPDGRLLTEQLPGLLTRRYHYRGGLLHRFMVARQEHPLADTRLRRDPCGRILTQRDRTRVREYRYDLAGQLIFADERHAEPEALAAHRAATQPGRAAAELHLGYDVAGNRVSLRGGGSETRYRYDAADQLVDDEARGRRTAYQYDPCGRVTEQDGPGHRLVITYDGFGQPATITSTSQAREERLQPVFDGDGLLTSLSLTARRPDREEERAASVRYRWGSFRHIPQILTQDAAPDLDDAEHDRPGRLSAEFSYGYGRTFASWEHGGEDHGAATFHRDVFGSMIRTGDTEPWVEADNYGPFGVAEQAARAQRADGEHAGFRPPELPRFGYRGELAIGSLIYLRARFYDPDLGRFLSPDPISVPTDPPAARNPYAYAANDPLQFTDPLGTAILVPGGLIGQLAKGAAIPRGSTAIPGTIAISQNVLVSASDPDVRALEAAWAWIIRQFGAPRNAQAEFLDWVRLCSLQPYGFHCQGELALDFSPWSLNYGLEGAFGPGASIVLSSIARGTIGGFVYPLYYNKNGDGPLVGPLGGRVQPYESGTYGVLIALSARGDCLQIHHVPQSNPAGQVIGGWEYQRGPAIALPNNEHADIPTRKGTYVGTAQELILEDILMLQTYTHASAAQIRQLVYWINRVLPGALPTAPGQTFPAEMLPGGGGEGEPDEGAAVPGE